MDMYKRKLSCLNHKRNRYEDFEFNAVLYNDNNYRDFNYFFGDFEYNGYENSVISFQIHNREGNTFIFEKPGKQIIINIILSILFHSSNNIIFFHNLRYDINIILDMIDRHDFEQVIEKRLDWKGNKIKLKYLVNGDCAYMKISLIGKRNKIMSTLELVDSMIFFPVRLDKAFKLLGIESHKTLTKTEQDRYFRENYRDFKDYCRFMKYAYNDVDRTDKIIEKIDLFMKKYDIGYSFLLSKAGLSKNIFIKYFIGNKYMKSYHVPDSHRFYVLYNSYRGGFTRYYKKREGKQVNCYDIKSSYPYAMVHKFPSRNCVCYTDDDYLKRSYHEVTGGMFFNHMKLKEPYDLLPKFDKQKRLCYYNELKGFFLSVEEFLFFREQGIIEEYEVNEVFYWYCLHTPYKEFVNQFYEEKEKSKGIDREFNKIILNSLYGSTIERYEEEERYCFDDKEIVKMGSGKLHSVVYANRITALSRITLYKQLLPNFSNCLYCDTDSIFIEGEIETGNNLGDWELETTGENFIVLGRKKYLLYQTPDFMNMFGCYHIWKIGSLGVAFKSKLIKKEMTDKEVIDIYEQVFYNREKYLSHKVVISKKGRDNFNGKKIKPNEVYETKRSFTYDNENEN